MNIIIKADDLAGYPGKDEIIPKRWQKFVDIIENYNIKATIGIIGNSLVFDDKEYFNWIKKYNDDNLIEFFNHGFLHRQFNFDSKTYQEFNGTTTEYQLQLINHTNKLAKEKLNIDLVTFGSPYNAKDKNTMSALNQSSIKYWFGGFNDFKGFNLTQRLDIEKPTHKVNLEYFKDNFGIKEYSVIQVHPNSWDRASFEDFELMIEFLLEKRCKFIFAKDII